MLSLCPRILQHGKVIVVPGGQSVDSTDEEGEVNSSITEYNFSLLSLVNEALCVIVAVCTHVCTCAFTCCVQHTENRNR